MAGGPSFGPYTGPVVGGYIDLFGFCLYRGGDY
jgi:hypothetical protein